MDQIAYHPIRISHHTSLFLPYTQQELDAYKTGSLNPLRSHPPTNSSAQSSNQLTKSSSSSGASPPHSPPTYSAPSPLLIPIDLSTSCPSSESHSILPQPSISQVVAHHYNSRPNLTKDGRTESTIYGLRKFNNWIKSLIIGKFGSMKSKTINELALKFNRNSNLNNNDRFRLKVLELGCGKGGDLAKWQNAGVRELYGLDIANVSIQQAQQRYSESRKKTLSAKFIALDCFSVPIESVMTQDELSTPFHVVSLQFCMHYAFETQTKARTMLQNVTKFLTPGGVFIGTIPDSDILMDRWKESSNQPRGPFAFGNSIYQVQFPNPFNPNQDEKKIYGVPYQFYLEDAVENVPEYVVYWEPFVQLAKEFGLRLIYKEGFHDIYQTEKALVENQQLLKRMNVIDEKGNFLINHDQWEVSGLYLAFAFIKE
ncbi:hypothetical protein O181_053264 [Austropuccinia psidii MF-1]|uniref:mRNA cap guanine-N(7) methyltransferase n=1 Tax=Austropuccinia psidii MF-1 TaxID=1389203 RepID=A0A9Q3HSH1_9BASI|nr:hypothetical protein [Austropuccinia psidii MF-1]